MGGKMARPRILREEYDLSGVEGSSGTQLPPTGMPNPKDGELYKRPIFLSVPTLVHPGESSIGQCFSNGGQGPLLINMKKGFIAKTYKTISNKLPDRAIIQLSQTKLTPSLKTIPSCVDFPQQLPNLQYSEFVLRNLNVASHYFFATL